MASPFEFDDVPPPVEPVRLPRRQAGGSPQGMAVTVVADYTLRTRAWLPSAAIVALLAESRVTPAGARTALSRLTRRGALENGRQGRHTFYRLTRGAAHVLADGGRLIASSAGQAEAWDGQWTLVAFSLPQEADTQRRALRGRLRWLGYAPLYDGLWVSPRGLRPETAETLAKSSLATVTTFRARHVEIEGITGRGPLAAWDLAAVAERYAAFVQRWSPMLPRIRSWAVDGTEALRARTEVMESYRHFIVTDPHVPARMMPAGWLRQQARAVFEAVYDGLAAPALDHVLGVVARFVDGPRPDIGTHTVADLMDGIQPADPGISPG